MASLMESPPGPETVIDGVRYLYFGGTGYLGLGSHPEVIAAGCDAMRRYGVHSATTRARIGTNPPVADTERLAATFFNTESAFYFGSGYVANTIMLAALCDGIDSVLVDDGAHYCLHEAARASGLPVDEFRHRDPDSLADVGDPRQRVLVMTDAVCPSTGELAPVRDYLEVLDAHPRALLLLDDAHGFGVLGPSGRGLLEELDLWPHANRHDPDHAEGTHLFACGTLAKALGGFGGIIPGTSPFVQHTRTSSHFFDGASAPPSAVAGASAKALELIMSDPSHRERLRANIAHLRRGLRDLGLTVPEGNTAHCGVGIGDAANMLRLHTELRERGIMLPYVGEYSGLPDGGVLRFAVFANHTTAQIDLLLHELRTLL